MSICQETVCDRSKKLIEYLKAATEPETRQAPLFLGCVEGVGEAEGSSLLHVVSGPGVLW